MSTTLVVPWIGANGIGLQPQDPFDSDTKPFTVAWGPRLSTVWIHFDAQDLTVKPGAGPDPVGATGTSGTVPTPPTTTTVTTPGATTTVPGATTTAPGTTTTVPGTTTTVPGDTTTTPGETSTVTVTTPAPATPATPVPVPVAGPLGPVGVSPLLRPHPLVVRVAPRKEPVFLRKMGLGVTLVLNAPATVTVVLVRPARKGVLRAKVTRTAHKRLPSGRTRLRLRLSDTGRVLSRRKLTVAQLDVTVVYEDGTQAHVTKPFRIQRG